MLLTRTAGVLKLPARIIQTSLDYTGTHYPDDGDFIPLNLTLIDKQIYSPGVAGLDHDSSSFILTVKQVLGQVMGAGLVEYKPINIVWLIDE